MSRVVVLSGGDNVRFNSYINHAVYSEMHNFEYVFGIQISNSSKAFNDRAFTTLRKIDSIRRYLSSCDFLLWLDDDVYITDLHSTVVEDLISHMVDNDCFFSVGNEVPPAEMDRQAPINAGVMIWKNDPRSFEMLDYISKDDYGLHVESSWASYGGGSVAGGDQDRIRIYILDNNFEGVYVAPFGVMQSRPDDYISEVSEHFAVHFMGFGYPCKVRAFLDFVHRFKLSNHILVDEDTCKLFGLNSSQKIPYSESLIQTARCFGIKMRFHIFIFNKKLRLKWRYLNRKWRH